MSKIRYHPIYLFINDELNFALLFQENKKSMYHRNVLSTLLLITITI